MPVYSGNTGGRFFTLQVRREELPYEDVGGFDSNNVDLCSILHDEVILFWTVIFSFTQKKLVLVEANLPLYFLSDTISLWTLVRQIDWISKPQR